LRTVRDADLPSLAAALLACAEVPC
jgi:hypothetical protein